MDEADPSDVSVTVNRDGVSVEKSYEPDDFPVPAIAFVFRSEREDEAVTVRLSDTVPEGVDPQDVGFHPEYGQEHWSVEGDRIVFERSLDPEEEYTTVYGLRSAVDDVSRYLSEPDLESVDPSLEEPGGKGGDETGGGLDESVPEIVGEAEDEEDEEISLDLADPPAGVESAVTETDGSDDATAAGTDADPDADASDERPGGGISPANVAEALAAELREGAVSERARETLRAELSPERGSVDARIADLQSEVADLRAYTDALEAFLDEEGGARQVLDDLDARVSDVEATLADIDDRADRNAERIGEVDADLAALVDEVDAVEARVDDVESSVETVRKEIDADIEDRVGDLEDRLDGIQDDLEQLDQMRKQLSSVFEPAGDGD